MTATHTGEAFGFPASGNPITHVEELLKLTQRISAGAEPA
jgi:hypothetical protein